MYYVLAFIRLFYFLTDIGNHFQLFRNLSQMIDLQFLYTYSIKGNIFLVHFNINSPSLSYFNLYTGKFIINFLEVFVSITIILLI